MWFELRISSREVVVVEWSAYSPYTHLIWVQIPLKSTAFYVNLLFEEKYKKFDTNSFQIISYAISLNYEVAWFSPLSWTIMAVK